MKQGEFRALVYDKDLSDNFVMEKYSTLLKKNFQWKFSNKDHQGNPFFYVDSGTAILYIRNRRPELYKVLDGNYLLQK